MPQDANMLTIQYYHFNNQPPGSERHCIVGESASGHEYTLNITLRANRVTIAIGTNHAEKFGAIAEDFAAHGLEVVYINDPYSGERTCAHTRHFNLNDAGITTHLELINSSLFSNQISEQQMTTLRQATGAPTLEDDFDSMDIDDTPRGGPTF